MWCMTGMGAPFVCKGTAYYSQVCPTGHFSDIHSCSVIDSKYHIILPCGSCWHVLFLTHVISSVLSYIILPLFLHRYFRGVLSYSQCIPYAYVQMNTDILWLCVTGNDTTYLYRRTDDLYSVVTRDLIGRLCQVPSDCHPTVKSNKVFIIASAQHIVQDLVEDTSNTDLSEFLTRILTSRSC